MLVGARDLLSAGAACLEGRLLGAAQGGARGWLSAPCGGRRAAALPGPHRRLGLWRGVATTDALARGTQMRAGCRRRACSAPVWDVAVILWTETSAEWRSPLPTHAADSASAASQVTVGVRAVGPVALSMLLFYRGTCHRLHGRLLLQERAAEGTGGHRRVLGARPSSVSTCGKSSCGASGLVWFGLVFKFMVTRFYWVIVQSL